MIIGIDLDGCLIVPGHVEFSAKALGIDVDETDVKDWKFSTFPENLRQMIFSCFTNVDVMCNNIKIIDGAQAKIKEWSDAGHEIYVITARDEILKEKTLELVSTNFPEVTETILVGFNESKRDMLEAYHCNLFIDDSPTQIEAGINYSIHTIMISNKYTSYNHHLRDKIEWYKCIGDIPNVI